MDTCCEQGVTQLSRGERLCLDDAAEHTVALVDGMVWITQEGRRDAFLASGDSFAFEPGSAVVQAITNTRLIESPERTEAALSTCGEGHSQHASSATTKVLCADHSDQFNLK